MRLDFRDQNQVAPAPHLVTTVRIASFANLSSLLILPIENPLDLPSIYNQSLTLRIAGDETPNMQLAGHAKEWMRGKQEQEERSWGF